MKTGAPSSAAKLAALRREYQRHALSETDVDPDPIKQFKSWFDEAEKAGQDDVNAMTLATATADGLPSARIVLLKEFDERGFVFFTNLGSRKGNELENNPRAALVFYWHVLERQVRIEGQASYVAREESAAYFVTRPRESRIAAWASRQSALLRSREELEKAYRLREQEFRAGDVPLPDFWGGFRIAPVNMEFWQGRESRLHDRIRYERIGPGWSIARLSP
ncbi:MAG: pyridoxamine 5'-phosphate oxidase [Ignavibacteria bacterium GWA2_55_11]|nr:MAG: pyridoxamine 5'-phosphate oxidase [Ignavibacteria bacterium GWA2_55_11]OGU75641.1 MAG: pyridoxamine 5'-phosphate oxidase [Ignavibacteria bacterium RIFCSPLOWO2_02_FULL_55_14]OGU76647.1 MAG: pyridoxamine 5'-phosphate oxidase [Ignavibacteria bacterium RIFCSPLOWO2_12_FULL_56_21]